MIPHEIVKCVNGLDPTGFHPDDSITPVEDPELMSRQDPALVLKQAQDSVIKDVAANVGIDGTERVIHDDNVGVEVNGSSNVEALLLSTGDGDASFTNFSHVSIGKHVQILLKSTTA